MCDNKIILFIPFLNKSNVSVSVQSEITSILFKFKAFFFGNTRFLVEKQQSCRVDNRAFTCFNFPSTIETRLRKSRRSENSSLKKHFDVKVLRL